jgi:hypothetical protein
METISHRYWEYKDFIYDSWQPDETWSCVSYRDNYWLAEARQFFWETSRDRIMAELQKWLDQGWELLEDVGPDAIAVSQVERKVNNAQIIDVFLWIMTLGIAFILQYWLNNPRRVTVYKPVEFRVKMRRLTTVNARHEPIFTQF